MYNLYALKTNGDLELLTSYVTLKLIKDIQKRLILKKDQQKLIYLSIKTLDK